VGYGRATKLGNISPIGQSFVLGSLQLNILAYYFPRQKIRILFSKKGWAKFWAIFTQTHSVTLAYGYFDCEKNVDKVKTFLLQKRQFVNGHFVKVLA
jgi:hypothetical protein